MKKLLQIFIFVLISFSSIFSDKINELFDTDFLETIDKTAYNINTKTIQYGLTYNKSILKVFIKTEDKIQKKVKFVAFLRSENNHYEYPLRCSYPHEDIIECKTKSGLKLDVDDRYYIYYNRSKKEKLIFDYEDIMEDDKRISLIFKPELYVNQTVYLDNKKIMAQIKKKCTASGYLYVIKQTKKVQNIPKDGFNKFFELNNFIYEPDYTSDNLFDIFNEAIRKGYLMIEAEITLTKDNVTVVYPGKNDITIYNQNLVKFPELLKLCKNNEIILDIKFNYINLNNEKNDIKTFLKIILEEIEQNEMVNSVIFNDNMNLEIISKLKKIGQDVAIAISTITTREEVEKLQPHIDSFSRVILTVDSNINNVALEYIKSLKYKIKFSKVESNELADKLTLNGVNYISTKNLEPFLIHNDKDFPMRVECVPIFLDDLSECKMYDEHVLRDNEFYNIHYSTNIYEKSVDINETAIGEFRYEDTKINDMRYYVTKKLDFKKGVIELITSDKIPEGKTLKGIVGPNYDNVANSYLFDFICTGIGYNFINCQIQKNKTKIEFDGEYVIYKVDNYSYSEEEITDWNLMKLKNRHIYSSQEKIIYTFIILIISFALFYYIYLYEDENKIISNIYY